MVPTVLLIDPYARVSTDDQSLGLETQLARVRAYESLYGGRADLEFRLGEPVVDDGASGRTLDRPGLKKILARLDRGESQGVIVAKMDRLTRDLGDWQYLISRYFGEKPGKRLIAVENEVNTMTSNGRAMLNMVVLMAQWERETIAERTRDALRQKIRRGERCGSVRYGRVIDPAHPARSKTSNRPNGLAAHPAEAEAVALMAELRDGGASLRAIAAELKARGIPTKLGRSDWEPKTIARILKRAY